MTRKSCSLKPIFLGLVALAALGGFLGGCKAAKGAARPSELTIWMPPFGTADTLDKDFWAEQFVTFEKENNVKVNIQIIPWGGYEEKYLTGISSNAGPDVGYMYLEMVADFINMGALEPFDSALTQKDKDNYLYLKNGQFNGKQYMLPIVVGNPRIILCNMTLLNKAGIANPPKTWEELIAAGLALKKALPDVYPFVQPWGDTNVGFMNGLYYPFLWQAGGRIFDDQGKLALGSSEAIAAAQFLYDLRFKYGITSDISTSLKDAEASNMFLEGKAAMYGGTPAFATTSVQPSGMKWDYTILRGAKRATFVAVDSLIVTSNSKNKELAFKAAKFMTSGPVMMAFHQKLINFPPIGKDETYTGLEQFRSLYSDKSIEFNNYPAIPGYYKVNDNLYKNLQLMMLRQVTPAEVMKSTVEYAETVLK